MRILTINPRYQRIISNGQFGSALPETGKIFWDTGYGVLRSNWNMKPNKDTWMMLLAATHSMIHKHNGDLSFLLYHKGSLFVDAGNRNYNYTEEKTPYIYSSYGHNVLFVNEEGWKLKPAPTFRYWNLLHLIRKLSTAILRETFNG